MANSHDIVAHNWAHQTGRKRRGFNMFYEGDTIYSYGYHFPLAKFFTAPNGERVVLVNDASYSVSTSKHQTIVRRALGYQREDVVYVPDLSRMQPKDWITKLDKDIETSAGKWQRARVYKASHARNMEWSIKTINRIIDLWQLDEPYRFMPGDIGAYIAASEERRKAEAKAKDLKDREDIKKWLNGEDVRPPHTRIPYVRVKNYSVGTIHTEHKSIVETSWGVRVPLDAAMKLHRLAGLVRIVGKPWSPKSPASVDGWPIKGIGPDGTLTVGCHVIPFKVQQEAAKLAGLDPATFHIN